MKHEHAEQPPASPLRLALHHLPAVSRQVDRVRRSATQSPSTSARVSALERLTRDGFSSHAARRASSNSSADKSPPVEADLRPAHREVRTLPSWVRECEIERDDDAGGRHDGGHAQGPGQVEAEARLAQAPSSLAIKHKVEPGRRHDACRDRLPVTATRPPSEQASRWIDFARASALPACSDGEAEKVSDEWLRTNMPDLEAPWRPGSAFEADKADDGTVFSSSRKRHEMWKAFLRGLMIKPMVPLLFRLIIWVFSLAALAVAASIYGLSRDQRLAQRPSTLMAISFDAIALVYGLYITYDEYAGKPLGLRSPADKMRLILLDLFFIVFNSANLSLAFDALYDVRWTCSDADDPASAAASPPAVPPKDDMICQRQRTLSSLLLIVLIAWLLTFTVSVFRLVERVNRE